MDYTAQLNKTRAADAKKQNQKPSPKKPTPSSSRIMLVELLLILPIALGNDIIDYFGAIFEITGIVFIILKIIDLISAFILGFYCLFRLKKFPAARFAVSGFIEIIPILGDIAPTWTIFLIWTYLEQRGSLPKFLQKASQASAGKLLK